MPKLKTEPIQKDDLVEFLDSYSDFSFELSVLKMMRKNQIVCEHGGLYEDPVTGKFREFDIRAIKTISNYRVRLAVECKNIRENFPVLVSCVPRHEDESYHQIVSVGEPKSESLYASAINLYQSRATALSLRDDHTIYKADEFVGKSIAQVGRDLNSNISSNDSELYDKWAQSLSSSSDLVSRTYWDGDEDEVEDIDHFLSTVIPIIVMPDERLWCVNYDEDGNRVSEPEKANRCSCFVDKDYKMGTKTAGTRLHISHVEIMTFTGLQQFINQYLISEVGVKNLFPIEGIADAYTRMHEE